MRYASRISGKQGHLIARAAIALGAVMLLTPLAVAGPPGHTVHVGILGVFAPSFDPATYPAAAEFIDGLRELGYTPGRDIIFEYKSAQGNPEAMPQLAEELVRSRVDILLTLNTSLTLAAAKVTKTVPIVMVGATDVVDTGLVASLARPGGNITGLAVNAAEIAAKRVQLLQDAVPLLSRVAVLWNTTLPGMALALEYR